MIISRSIHVAADDITSFFFMAEWYSIVFVCVCVCVCVCVYNTSFVSVHLLMDV